MLGRKTLAGFTTALIVSTLAACAGSGSAGPAKPANPPLRVAVPRDVPPYAYRQGDQLVGLEIDFARELAAGLGRPLDVQQVDFVDIIPTVRAGKADVAMAGMTITPARSVQIAFSQPYLRSGLLAMMRREDTKRYPTPKRVFGTTGNIGVVTGTTAERFVREQAPLASVSVYPDARAAVDELRQRRVDIVLHDAPVVIWFVSNDEANLAALLTLLNAEDLGWGVNRNDEALHQAVDGLLARWRTDGTRDRILARWLPYWSRLESQQRP